MRRLYVLIMSYRHSIRILRLKGKLTNRLAKSLDFYNRYKDDYKDDVKMSEKLEMLHSDIINILQMHLEGK